MDNPFIEDKPEFDENALGVVASMANKMLEIEEEIASLEDQLKQEKMKFRDLNEQQIPDKLMEMGLSQIKLSDGTVLSISPYYSAKIPENRKKEAFAFLEANGQDAIIKSRVDLTFGKGEKERRDEDEVIGFLSRQGIPFKQKRGVHPQTLRAFVREQIENGVELPTDLFGVYIGNKTKVKRG